MRAAAAAVTRSQVFPQFRIPSFPTGRPGQWASAHVEIYCSCVCVCVCRQGSLCVCPMSTETEVLHVPDLPSVRQIYSTTSVATMGDPGESRTSSRGILLIWRNFKIQKKRTKHVFPFDPKSREVGSVSVATAYARSSFPLFPTEAKNKRIKRATRAPWMDISHVPGARQGPASKAGARTAASKRKIVDVDDETVIKMFISK